ncbi:hypothetical protein BDZ89DRAFT_1035336 [Hymenopellis radicata]|nr:hypothetical protein BDZ89DRAFT_1035336 [Hymenopellis radicata]
MASGEIVNGEQGLAKAYTGDFVSSLREDVTLKNEIDKIVKTMKPLKHCPRLKTIRYRNSDAPIEGDRAGADGRQISKSVLSFLDSFLLRRLKQTVYGIYTLHMADIATLLLTIRPYTGWSSQVLASSGVLASQHLLLLVIVSRATFEPVTCRGVPIVDRRSSLGDDAYEEEKARRAEGPRGIFGVPVPRRMRKSKNQLQADIEPKLEMQQAISEAAKTQEIRCGTGSEAYES